MENNLDNNNSKIEIFNKDLFFVFNHIRYLRLFKFKENKMLNKFYIKQIIQIEEKANDIFIDKNRIICIKNGYINTYKLLKNILQLETKISIPFLISNFSLHKGIIMKDKK